MQLLGRSKKVIENNKDGELAKIRNCLSCFNTL